MRRVLCCAGAVTVVTAAFLATPGPAAAQDASGATDAVKDDIARYCTNIADAARDRRYVIQRKKLEDLQTGIDGRMKKLEAKRAEYQDWLTRRNAFLKTAQAGLVDIYAKMDADAAANQLELLDPNIAAAVIMKLQPSKASSILNEMQAKKAALLAGIIASAGDPTTSRNPS